MRNAFAVFAFCFIVAIPVAAQDLSIFDKKTPSSEVKTELYVMDVDRGAGEERKVGEDVRQYGGDGELITKTFTNSSFTVKTEFTCERDKDGRVVKRTSKDTYKIGNGEPMTGSVRSWEYSYDESGAATVVSKEPQAEGDESTPVVETWKLDASGKMLEYSKVFGEQSLKAVYERDKTGKLLSKTDMYCDKVTSKETCTYRDDGTLKESSESDPEKNWAINRHFDERGEEVKGEVLGKDGAVERQWVVERKLEKLDAGTVEEMKITVHGATADKLEGVLRYVVTTTLKK